jgi:hypothetical protein
MVSVSLSATINLGTTSPSRMRLEGGETVKFLEQGSK